MSKKVEVKENPKDQKKDQKDEKQDKNVIRDGDEVIVKKGNSYFRIMKYFRKKALFFTAIFLTVCAGVGPMIMNIIMGDMATLMTGATDDFSKQAQEFVVWMALYCVLYSTLMEFKDLACGYSGPWFLTNIRVALYRKLMALDIPFFDLHNTGMLLNKFTNDCAVLNEVYVAKFFQAFQNVAQAVAGLITAFIYCWQATLACLIGFPLCALTYWIGEILVGRMWADFNKSTSDASTKAEQVIAAFRTVKSFDNEMLEARKFRKSLHEIVLIYNKTSIIIAFKDGIVLLIVNAMLIGFLYFASWIIIERPSWGLENGDLMVVVASIIFTSIGVQQALALIDDFERASISAEKILDVLECPVQVNQREGETLDHPLKGKVEFKDVTFKYQTNDDYAVKHLSFVVNPGETVALVGESGCGKSTTLQLLQRFYEIESGQILVDDIDIRTLSPQYLRSQISIVPQAPVLFSMSIKDNIRYAKPKANEKQVAEAAQIGNAHNFIMQFPENYKTNVDISSLSGGQKQRICISRAILVNAPILLLDEATAALDTESERLVQQSLETVRKGKTAILVAHRLATVINSDRILVFKDGAVVESGKHAELLAKNGYYADLIKFQLQ